jgi:hypothetical protein
MPSNVAWLLSRLVTPADETDLVASPAGDSLEIRARRARAAAERAEEAQGRAVEAAREYEALAAHLREVVERGQARVEEIERETSERVRHRVEQAQKAAEEFVRRERQEAEAEADAQREQVEEEVEHEMVEVENEAEAAQHRAEELVADAAHALAEARRLAAEAAEAARVAAEAAERKAYLIQDGRGDAAEELRKRAAATAKPTALDREETNGLDAYKKTELVELAAGIGIKGRAGMTKGELVDAIMDAARGRARETNS